MMVISVDQLADILQFLVVAFIWVVVVFKLVPYARLDGFRQDMFAIRDELFDYAADGNISFDHPAYTLLREQMNGFIRYGHDLTVFRFVMMSLVVKIKGRTHDKVWFSEWSRALA